MYPDIALREYVNAHGTIPRSRVVCGRSSKPHSQAVRTRNPVDIPVSVSCTRLTPAVNGGPADPDSGLSSSACAP